MNPKLVPKKRCPFLRICTFAYFIMIINLTLYANDPIFGNRIDMGLIEYYEIDEASGIAASRINPGVLWTHNDSGDPNRVFALDLHGRHLGIYTIEGITNRDWEDMAVGPGPVINQQYLYIAEIGDNQAQYNLKYIYRVPEPIVDSSQTPIDTTILGAETITFQYPDGTRDAETLMIDPLTKDIYIISKREIFVRVYLAPYPQSTTDTITVSHVATLDLSGGQTVNEYMTVGGDISPFGDEILIKTYAHVFYWHRTMEPNLWEVFNNEPDTATTYIPEPQGEALCWDPNASGYYTVSEERNSIPAHLYYYPRTTTGIAAGEIISQSLLDQNYPNPFNPTTNIEFSISKSEFVTLKIYNILGEEVATLVSERLAAGTYKYDWDASSLASGVYLYRIQAGEFQQIKKMVFIQ